MNNLKKNLRNNTSLKGFELVCLTSFLTNDVTVCEYGYDVNDLQNYPLGLRNSDTLLMKNRQGDILVCSVGIVLEKLEGLLNILNVIEGVTAVRVGDSLVINGMLWDGEQAHLQLFM